MDMRTLGQHGPLVSRIGLGLAALGRPGYINLGHGQDLRQDYAVEGMRDRAAEVMDAAWAAGVRYFDTARSYGKGEAFLGHWLHTRGRHPEEIAVGSKWGYTYTADWKIEAVHHEVKEHTLPVLTRQWAETQAELGPWLDLYQIHSATLDSGVLDRPEVLGELARLKAGGTRIGLSLSGPGQSDTLERALSVEVDGQALFDAVQATWNLLERSAGPALSAAHEAGLGIIIKEALANGRLTPRNDATKFAMQRLTLEQEALRLGCTIDALALAGVMAQPWVDVVLSGVATIEHLHSNLAAVDVPWDGEAEATLAALVETPEAYWQTRKGLAWN